MAEKFAWLNAAVAVQTFCLSRKFSFAFIGGVAVQHWGEPRVTLDIDLTLYVGFGLEERFIDEFLAFFRPRINDPRTFALKQRVLLLKSQEGIGIDIALGGFPFEEEMTGRASFAQYFPGIQLKICSAEDLIVMKSFAGRAQDWLDVERIIVRQTGKLDWGHIRKHLRPLAELKEAPEIVDQLERLRLANER